MKQIKLILIVIVLLFSFWATTGCRNAEKENELNQAIEKNTVASSLVEQFKKEIENEKNIEKVANALSNNEKIQTQMNVFMIEENDYITGFQTKIKDFDKAVGIRPIIGTIPFIAYIFETKNPEELVEILKSNADLRWNICTEADNMEVAVVNNFVFFIMSPETFE